MSKQPDFADDLAALSGNVTAAVDDVLHVLQQKRSKGRPSVAQKDDTAVTATERATVVESAPPVEKPPASSAPRHQRFARRAKFPTSAEEDEPLENVTTRLRRSTNDLLTEAALRQRLKKVVPDSRQSIVEEALRYWFQRHGYS